MQNAAYHVFVLWPKAMPWRERILADISSKVEIICTKELSWPCPALEGYGKFYGSVLVDAKRKARRCGSGPFLVVVVRDSEPDMDDNPLLGNRKVNDMKEMYRNWTGKHKFRVHASRTRDEFDANMLVLSGKGADWWESKGDPGEWRIVLPEWWVSVSKFDPFERGGYLPGEKPEIEGAEVLFRNKTLNSEILRGRVLGRDCIVKHSTTATWSIGNSYRTEARMHAIAPMQVPAPVAMWTSSGGESAYIATEWLEGKTLTDVLAEGPLPEKTADAYAADILEMAAALEKSKTVHRDIFTDNLFAAADGHLKLIDWQTALFRPTPNEDPWVRKHWKFRYVVLGVNRDTPPGVWNDFTALDAVLNLFPQTAAVEAARKSLQSRFAAAEFRLPPRKRVKLLLRLYAFNLFFQAFFRKPGKKRDRILRRRLTILAKGKVDVDARRGLH